MIMPVAKTDKRRGTTRTKNELTADGRRGEISRSFLYTEYSAAADRKPTDLQRANFSSTDNSDENVDRRYKYF